MALSIGELGRRTETKVETIRYYERIGLLIAPARTEGNYRAYGEAELNRLSFIRRARDLGFSIEQVHDLLALSDRRGQSCAEVDALAGAHLADVEHKIADLEALRRELSALLSQCRKGTISTCLIIEALGQRRPNRCRLSREVPMSANGAQAKCEFTERWPCEPGCGMSRFPKTRRSMYGTYATLSLPMQLDRQPVEGNGACAEGV